MSLFTIISDEAPPMFHEHLVGLFGSENVFRINNYVWFLHSEVSTPKILFAKIVDGDAEDSERASQWGRMVITLMNAAWGYHEADLWPWLSSKAE